MEIIEIQRKSTFGPGALRLQMDDFHIRILFQNHLISAKELSGSKWTIFTQESLFKIIVFLPGSTRAPHEPFSYKNPYSKSLHLGQGALGLEMDNFHIRIRIQNHHIRAKKLSGSK